MPIVIICDGHQCVLLKFRLYLLHFFKFVYIKVYMYVCIFGLGGERGSIGGEGVSS